MQRIALLAILLAGCRDPIGYTAVNGKTWCELYAQRGGYERLGWCVYSTGMPIAIIGALIAAAMAVGVGATMQWRAARARATEWDARSRHDPRTPRVTERAPHRPRRCVGMPANPPAGDHTVKLPWLPLGPPRPAAAHPPGCRTGRGHQPALATHVEVRTKRAARESILVR